MRSMKKVGAGLAVAMAAAFGCAGAWASVLKGTVSIDNGYVLYVSTSNSTAGTGFGSGENWESSEQSSVTLDAGTNYYLHIFAYDTGGIAGVLGQFSLEGTGHHFANGSTTLYTNTTDWMGNQSGFADPYAALNDLGPNGVGPWGGRAGIGADAHWVWSGDANANDISFLTAQILADAPQQSDVPEPGTLALLGAGLAGISRLRKRSKQR